MSVTLVNPYCTEAQVRSYIKNNDSSIQDQLLAAINAASRWIDEYKGQDYFEHDFTAAPGLVIDDWMERSAKERLWIGYKPVIEWVSLTVGGELWTRETTPGVQETPAADYRLRADSGEVISFRGHWLPDKNIFPGMVHTGVIEQLSPNWSLQLRGAPEQVVIVKGRFGYAQRQTPVSPDTRGVYDSSLVPAGMPAFINQACIELAAVFSRWNMKDVVGLDGQRTSILSTDIPKSVQYLLGARAKVMV